MNERIVCYGADTDATAHAVCGAFAEGCDAVIAAAGETELLSGAAFFYGWNEQTVPLIQQCRGENRTWFYADSAYYLGRGEYHRVTRNTLMHDGQGTADPMRFHAFGIAPKPWRPRNGPGHILITTSSERFYRDELGMSRDAWIDAIVDELKRHTAREIRVHNKSTAHERGSGRYVNFESMLAGAWALVTLSSATAVAAILDGIPVFSLGLSMASCMGLADLTRIENPYYPSDRERWLAVLCANQWTMQEMREGRAWRDLQAQSPACERGVAYQ